MLRTQLNDALKEALRNKQQAALGTIRLILAALKDRDIQARGNGNSDGISEQEIQQMLQKMIKQRREAIKLYEQGQRPDLVEKEQAEIEVIEHFLPKPLSEEEVAVAVDQVIEELGADSIKDMGRVMAVLRERFAGRMDSARASAQVKEKLA